jgi:type II secretory pathway pseudopilin PulG
MAASGSRADQGETLLELVVALAIMSVAVVALIGGLGTSITMSDVHRKQATAGVAVRNLAEAVTATVDAGGYPTSACAPLPAALTAPSGFTAPGGFTATVEPTAKSFWDGAGWQTSCTTETGLRQLKLQVTSADNRVVETLVIEARKPCGLRPSESICA